MAQLIAPQWQAWVEGCPHFAPVVDAQSDNSVGMGENPPPSACPFSSSAALKRMVEALPRSHFPDPTSLVPTNSAISVEAMLMHLSRTCDAVRAASTAPPSETSRGSDASAEELDDEESDGLAAAQWKKVQKSIASHAAGDVSACPMTTCAHPNADMGKLMRTAMGVRAAKLGAASLETFSEAFVNQTRPSGGPTGSLDGLTLSKAMKKVTEKVHLAAENATIVLEFQKNQLSRQAYIEMIAQFYYLYRDLELALHRASAVDERIDGLFDWKRLHRLPRLVADLAEALDVFPQGTESLENAVEREIAARFPPLPMTVEFGDRVDKLARMQPLMLAAHAYTRYLGDMSGGQILKKKAILLCPQAVAFYDFDESPELLKKEFRSRMDDGLRVTADERSALLHEACVSFIQNIRIFNDLDRARGASTRPIPSLQADMEIFAGWTSPLELQQIYAGAVLAPKTGAEKCPFLAGGEKQSNDSTTPSKSPSTISRHGECPWPFVLAHDPKKGLVKHAGKNVLLATTLVALSVALSTRSRGMSRPTVGSATARAIMSVAAGLALAPFGRR